MTKLLPTFYDFLIRDLKKVKSHVLKSEKKHKIRIQTLVVLQRSWRTKWRQQRRLNDVTVIQRRTMLNITREIVVSRQS